jgi:hypothetical protein
MTYGLGVSYFLLTTCRRTPLYCPLLTTCTELSCDLPRALLRICSDTSPRSKLRPNRHCNHGFKVAIILGVSWILGSRRPAAWAGDSRRTYKRLEGSRYTENRRGAEKFHLASLVRQYSYGTWKMNKISVYVPHWILSWLGRTHESYRYDDTYVYFTKQIV